MAKHFADRVCLSCSDKASSVVTAFDGMVDARQPHDSAENLTGIYVMGRQAKDEKVFALVIPKGAENVSYNATKALEVTIKIDKSLKKQPGDYSGEMEFDVSFDMADQNIGKSDALVALMHFDDSMNVISTRVLLRYPRSDDEIVDRSAVWTTVMHKKVSIKRFTDGDTVAIVVAAMNKPGYSAAIDDVKLAWKWKGFK